MTLSWLKNYNLLIFDQLDSTNNEAMRLAKTKIVGDFVIVASKQTAGKGQKGRKWESIPGNLHASLLLQSELDMNRLKELSFLTAVVLHKTISHFVKKLNAPKIDIKLKWPNDVLVDGKKLAGILLESTRINDINYIIIGVGVNTHFLPKIKNIPVTSMLNEGLIIRDPMDFLNQFIIDFYSRFEKWKSENSFVNIKKEWQKNAYRLNEMVTLDDDVQKISGTFTGINDEGAICIMAPDGQVKSFSAGDFGY